MELFTFCSFLISRTSEQPDDVTLVSLWLRGSHASVKHYQTEQTLDQRTRLHPISNNSWFHPCCSLSRCESGRPTVADDEEDEGPVPHQPADGGHVGVVLGGGGARRRLSQSRGELRALLENWGGEREFIHADFHNKRLLTVWQHMFTFKTHFWGWRKENT